MKRKNLLFLCLLSVLFYSCSCDRRKVTRTDTETSGVATIAADECFVPIMKEQLAVFTGLNPEATINPIYAGENEIFKMLVDDSVRLIIATRELREDEKATIESRNLSIRSQKIARDGIALIINKENTDSLLNINLLRKIMTGEISQWSEISKTGKSSLGNVRVVFDHPNSSTLRFITEMVTQGDSLSPMVKALGNNTEVIDFVTRTPNALGVIGVNWISNMNDSTQLSFNETIRVMSLGVENDMSEENTFKPFPVFLNNGSYPLVRDVFIILTDLRGTLPAGFVKFMGSDAGQRIILKAGLVPGTRPTREVYLKEDF